MTDTLKTVTGKKLREKNPKGKYSLLILEETTLLDLRAMAEPEDGSYRDFEADHQVADSLLCKMLRALGYDDIVNAFDKVGKWYA